MRGSKFTCILFAPACKSGFPVNLRDVRERLFDGSRLVNGDSPNHRLRRVIAKLSRSAALLSALSDDH